MAGQGGSLLRPTVREKCRAAGGAGRREQAHAALHTVVACSLDQIGRLKGVEFVNLHVAAELDVPVEPVFEYAVAQAVHFRSSSISSP